MENGCLDNVPCTSQSNRATTTETRTSKFACEIRRRKTTFEFQSQIRDEQRKAEQGILSEERIDEIYNQAFEQGRDLDNVESLRTIKADAHVLQQLIQLSTTELDKLRGETAKSLDPELFITRIEKFALDRRIDDGRSHPFVNLGKRCANLLRDVPDFYYLRPCIEIKEKPLLREKVERKCGKRTRKEMNEVKAQTLQQLQKEAAANEFSVSKELDNIAKHLRAYHKEMRSELLDYHRFVINPHSFGETVENMFYISFLVKDGRIGLSMDPNTGTPKIVKVPRVERAVLVERSQLETVQVLGTLDYSAWSQLVKKLGIKEPYIKR